MSTAAVLRLAASVILLSTFTLKDLPGHACIYSQTITDADSLVIGKSYKLVLFDDSEIIGKVISIDSQFVRVSGEAGIYRIRKEDIFSVSSDLTKNKFTSMLMLGGGTSIFGFGAETSRKWTGTYAFQFAALFPFDMKKGLRVETGYQRYKRDLPEHDYYNSPYLDIFSLKADFVIGTLLRENRVWLVGTAGVGMNYLYEPAFESSYYSYYDSTYHTDYHNGNGTTSGVLSIGFSLGYWFSKRLGFYFDLQFNTLTYGGFFIFYGGLSYLPMRAGLTYTLF